VWCLTQAWLSSDRELSTLSSLRTLLADAPLASPPLLAAVGPQLVSLTLDRLDLIYYAHHTADTVVRRGLRPAHWPARCTRCTSHSPAHMGTKRQQPFKGPLTDKYSQPRSKRQKQLVEAGQCRECGSPPLRLWSAGASRCVREGARHITYNPMPRWVRASCRSCRAWPSSARRCAACGTCGGCASRRATVWAASNPKSGPGAAAGGAVGQSALARQLPADAACGRACAVWVRQRGDARRGWAAVCGCAQGAEGAVRGAGRAHGDAARGARAGRGRGRDAGPAAAAGAGGGWRGGGCASRCLAAGCSAAAAQPAAHGAGQRGRYRCGQRHWFSGRERLRPAPAAALGRGAPTAPPLLPRPGLSRSPSLQAVPCRVSPLTAIRIAGRAVQSLWAGLHSPTPLTGVAPCRCAAPPTPGRARPGGAHAAP
jgi:hypothetical protein